MFVLAQISDPHLATPPRLADLASKRGLGFINWQRKRKYIHRPEILDLVSRNLLRQSADHIAVTGDLVNLSLPDEYARARNWLETLGKASDVTVIPGNHDVYVHGVELSPVASWGDYMCGDDGVERFPFLRRRGEVALIALSTGLPTGPFMATGRLGKTQVSRLAEMLEETRGLFRVVLIHHPPVSPPRRYLRRLIDAADLRRVIADKGAELLIHGHDHRRSLTWLDGPERPIPAVGAPSASASAPHGDENAAGYNLFRIGGGPQNRQCEMIGRELSKNGDIREVQRRLLSD
jgi:3',5'-cyclic AMP phosphodiesterase CpdA